MSTLWLASQSPRRRQLLEWSGYTLDIHPADLDETRDPWDPPVKHARGLAIRKAAIAPDDVTVVAADTVVHQGDTLFEKPLDRSESRAHLTALSGGWHRVTTGVCVRSRGQQEAFTVTTEVRFRKLSLSEIDLYLATGEADDKAGAYGIQGRGGSFIAELRGSWTNVMGLPIEETLEALARLGCPP